MPSLIHRRLSLLEERRDRRDVPTVVVMEAPLPAAQADAAAAHRRRGSVVVLLSADDMRL